MPDSLLHDRYRIVQLLGQGGMGVVYLAFDTALEQNVAIKINHREGVESAAQFYREARMLAALHHIHLPRVIDYFVIASNQVLVMDYIPGIDLREVIEQQGPQPVDQVLKWAQQLGSAIVFLHSQNPPIVHRDIKPSNIKLTPQGNVVLVDFGIARVTDIAQPNQTGASGYTPGFAPPEQYSAGSTSVFSDQFSLAATLYMLLSGQRPTDAVQRALNQAALTPLNELNPQVPASVQTAIEKALSPNVENRYPSVQAFLEALAQPMSEKNAAVTSEGASPRQGQSPSTQSSARKWVPWLMIAVCGAVLLIAAGGILGVKWLRTLTAERASSNPTPERSAATDLPLAHSASRPGEKPVTDPTVPVILTSAPSASATPPPLPSTATPTPANPLGGGGWVVFSSNRGDGFTYQLWKMEIYVDNTGQAYASPPIQITFDAGDKSQPSWSPDGTQLLYSAPGGVDSSGQDLGLDVWKINLDGSDPVNLTKKIGNDTDSTWSPDGKWIAFTNDGRADVVRQIYFMDPNGQNTRRISFDQEEFSPAWSPDGDTLLFVLHAANHDILYTRSSEDDFATYKNYDRGEILGRLGNVDDPILSPDGTQLAYTRVESHYQRVATVRYASGGSDILTLTNYTRDREPTWSRDANWIVFTSDRDGNSEIYIMNVSGQFPVNLTHSQSEDVHPVWQPQVRPSP